MMDFVQRWCAGVDLLGMSSVVVVCFFIVLKRHVPHSTRARTCLTVAMLAHTLRRSSLGWASVRVKASGS